jgi:hypothetical protein
VTPPQIWVASGITQYESEVHLDFAYPAIRASDTSGEKPVVTRLNNLNKGKA